MKRSTIILIIAAAIFIGGVVFILASGNRTPASDTTSAPHETLNPDASSTTGSTGGAASSYTLADVATHNSQSSCWTAINGNVYNLTSWISQHPGGEGAILSICGKDGTAAFEAQHGGQGRPNQELATFLIGSLSN